jgi:hypothetical protein
MSEPTTVITDYALGAVSIVLSWRLMEASRFWALAFFALGLGAFLGGTWHGSDVRAYATLGRRPST